MDRHAGRCSRHRNVRPTHEQPQHHRHASDRGPQQMNRRHGRRPATHKMFDPTQQTTPRGDTSRVRHTPPAFNPSGQVPGSSCVHKATAPRPPRARDIRPARRTREGAPAVRPARLLRRSGDPRGPPSPASAPSVLWIALSGRPMLGRLIERSSDLQRLTNSLCRGAVAQRELRSQTLTSRCRSAIVGRQVQVPESAPEAGRAATGTRVALLPRARLPARWRGRP